MALSRDQKTAQLEELKKKFSDAASVVFTHYIGLSVAEVSDFRDKLRESGAEMKVAKKTLMKRAAQEVNFPDIPDDVLDGPVACIFSFADPVTGAQVAFKYAKDHKQVALIGAVFDGQVLNKSQAMAFAQMPGREQLLAMFMSMCRAPLQNFASICTSPLRGFAVIAKELAEKGGFPAKSDAS